MSSTLLEQTRAAHEEVERMERLIMRELRRETRSHKEKLTQNHRVRKMMDTIQERSAKIARIYEDDDGARKDDIASMAGENVFSIFYSRLKETRDYHKRFPSNDITEEEDEGALLKTFDVPVTFTGEEMGGRCLDLHGLFHTFVNAKFGRQTDYVSFICSLSDFEQSPRHQRLGKPYRDFLRELLEYLETFYRKTQPLGNLEREQKKFEEAFAADWEAGKVEGWEDKGETQLPAVAEAGIDLEAFESAEELSTLGADRLKEALQALGLKAGGTLEQRAERLMLTKDRPLESLDRKLFAKGVTPAAVMSEAERAKVRTAAREAAALEGRVALMVRMLATVVDETVANVEKKQARTYDELQAELEEAEEAELEEDSDEEDDYVYNPLKLPLGWDGKPIPYWLYKLHGLNQEFKCEICGNYSYWGRRAFERHFKEWRHMNGMRALGIPNTKSFYEVTKIDDAVALHKTLSERQTAAVGEKVGEELEDAHGNVYDRKTYDDFRRQGLI
eukprot:jgi/Tetstr1/444520/TSEL_032399.t1